jgi:1,2-diacylglycerol 3-beta-galactosyltransferase
VKKIVILYSNVGGGHRSAAQAIQKAFSEYFPNDFLVEMINAIGFLPPPFKYSEQTYDAAINQARWAHVLTYQAFGLKWLIDGFAAFTSLIFAHPEDRFFAEHPADLYLSCQPHFNLFMPQAIKRLGIKAKYAHVVTDLFDCSAFHFEPLTDLCCVPTENAFASAQKYGLANVVLTGQPVEADFVARAAKRQATRARLGLDADTTTILLMAGGNGLDALGDIGLALLQSDLSIQLIAFCGHNKHSFQILNAFVGNKKAVVLEFSQEIPELMGAADIIVTKAGPGTIAEACIAGLPLVLFDAIPGQEEANVQYVLSEGLGAWCSTPSAVLAQLRIWLTQPNEWAASQDRALAQAKPNSVQVIASAMVKLSLL